MIRLGPTMFANSVDPILSVPDVAVALEYYDRVLGFSNHWTHGDPVVHGGVRIGTTNLQFSLDPEGSKGHRRSA